MRLMVVGGTFGIAAHASIHLAEAARRANIQLVEAGENIRKAMKEADISHLYTDTSFTETYGDQIELVKRQVSSFFEGQEVPSNKHRRKYPSNITPPKQKRRKIRKWGKK